MLNPETALRKDRTQPTAPSFQHRHYAEIARIIREAPELSVRRRDAMANLFARELRYTNPNFDEARFLRACGVET